MGFTDDEINRLRAEVPYVFTKITGKTFYISGDIDNESYEELAAHMRDTLTLPIGKIPGARACIRLFHEKQMVFQAKTLKRFDEYARACKKIIAEEEIVSSQSQIVLDGVEIIETDLQKISKSYKGLATALLYYYSINKAYDVEISWEAFLKLADYYNGNYEISRRFYHFNLRDPIAEILDRNITIEQLLVPYKIVHSFNIQEDLLVNEELSREVKDELALRYKIVVDGETHYYNHIANEVLKILLENDEMPSAGDLNYVHLRQKTIYMVSEAQQEFFSEKIKELSSYSYKFVEKRQHNVLKLYYSQAHQKLLYREWATRTLYLMICFPLENYGLLIIIKTLLKMGCTSLFFRELMDELSNVSKNDIPFKLKEIKHRLKGKFLLNKQLPKEYYDNHGFATLPYFNLD